MTTAEKIEEIRNCEDLSVETTYAAIEALLRTKRTCECADRRPEDVEKIY